MVKNNDDIHKRFLETGYVEYLPDGREKERPKLIPRSKYVEDEHPNDHASIWGSYFDRKEVTLADIPGLVEGAHKGIGLGDKFLRHIERCKVLLHLIDLSEDNLVKSYRQITKELSSYDKKLSEKKEIIFFNKIDTPQFKRINFQFPSCAIHHSF